MPTEIIFKVKKIGIMKQGLFYINKYNPKQRYNGLRLLSLNSRVVVFGTLLSIFVKSSTLKKKKIS